MKGFRTEYRTVGALRLLILTPRKKGKKSPGLLWLHGGGYFLGSAATVPFGRAGDIARELGAVVIAPEYRLAGKAPYPAALEDCYRALRYLYERADELGVDRERLIVGGESAGGGLTAALCLYARDKGDIPIRLQLPLYPMLDCEDTASSRDNHALVWNTRRNHYGWKKYLAGLDTARGVPPYASPARATDYTKLPPAYTFVCDGEPFYCETLAYIENLRRAGVRAELDVYHARIHAFDMLSPWLAVSREARATLLRRVRELWRAME